MLDFSRNVTFLGQGSISEIPVFLGSDPCLSLFCRNETRNDPVSATTKKVPHLNTWNSFWVGRKEKWQ